MGRNTILYADDEEGMRGIFARFIGKHFPEYEVEVFENGKDLAGRLTKGSDGLALVVTDNEMPFKKGSEVIETYARIMNVPFVLFYAGEREIGEKALKDGASECIEKPATLEELDDRISKYLPKPEIH